MALRSLTSWNDPLFRAKSHVVETFDGRLWTLLDDMLATLKDAGGYGCAAVHIGPLRRVAIVDDERGMIERINPEIIQPSIQTQTVREGSIAPGAPSGIVVRPKHVTVTGLDRTGERVTINASDYLAATLCYEIDHLDGILFSAKFAHMQR